MSNVMLSHLERFHQDAIKFELSPAAILLWQQLYFSMSRKQQFQHVQMHTAVLMSFLKLSRSGLQRARQSLMRAGLLQLEENAQKLYYTLLLQGNTLMQENVKAAVKEQKQLSEEAKQALQEPLVQKKLPAVTFDNKPGRAISIDGQGGVILTEKCHDALKEHHQIYQDIELRGTLRNWVEMRRKNGWTLTNWGLQELLKKLAELGGRSVKSMIAIVKQSLRRRWKGFYPLSMESRPSGEKLRKLEEKEERTETWKQRNQRKTVGKCSRAGDDNLDLSFLEE